MWQKKGIKSNQKNGSKEHLHTVQGNWMKSQILHLQAVKKTLTSQMFKIYLGRWYQGGKSKKGLSLPRLKKKLRNWKTSLTNEKIQKHLLNKNKNNVDSVMSPSP